ncbi:molybdopterin oxidoreductase family protein [Caenimonas soli]|uniref:molybdopterin oxidoreductase family protein n=1 Tax=Caenimonas soli TaxID=2735555 RepID=UPI0015582A9D|nr:molybdopterin oxidoreductase family protein [Caenimonas soli]NPC56252.1 molybdopterin-dependent oxidoreductase [Caenimonas soli]
MSETIHHRICPLCEACCGLELKVNEGKIVSIRGHEADVFSAGYICPKGVALKDLHEDPDRLRTPLIKRDGEFVEATWDEAFAEIERRLPPVMAAHGRDAVAMSLGNPAAHKIGLLMYGPKLMKALGTRSIFSASTLDQMPKHLSSGLVFGHMFSIPIPDIVRTDYLLMLGANPMASNGSLWTVPDFRGKAKALRARGGKFVVVDPRRTETAALADEHHFIRPGADVFLLLGMVHTLFDENLVRLGRVAPHVDGVDAVQSAVQPFAPEKVADRCGIPAADIRRLARELAAAPRAAVYGRIGTCTQEYGTLVSWLVDVLNTLTGHLDEPGGAMFAKAAAFAANTAGTPGSGRGVITGRHKSRVSGAPEVFGELPMTCMAEEMETSGPGQIRALITIGSNPVLSSPNGLRLAAALDKLDFMISMDIYVNETSRHADVILPAPSALEDSHYDVAFPQLSWRNHARYSAAVFDLPQGQLPEWATLLKLTAIVQGGGAKADPAQLDAEQFGREATKLFADKAAAVIEATAHLKGPSRLLDMALRNGPYGDGFGATPDGLNLAKVQAAPGGIDLGELTPRVPEMLRTPSGKIELAPPSLLADLQRPAQDLARQTPSMVIIGRREVRSNNSWMHNLPLLAKGPERCTALVHPEDAQRLGLADGTMARISSRAGSIEARVQLSGDMMPGVVSLPHGWGHNLAGTRLSLAAKRPGANLNDLLDENWRDPLSGNAVLSGIEVELAVA